MSVSTEITRITTARNTIRTKAVALGIATSTANIEDLADAIDLIENRGSVAAQVKEGETYTIPKGYHNGSGTVQGVSGGGNYSLQAKTIAPTKSQQNVSPDSGYYGLSSVTVDAIPSNYQDVQSVTATAPDVLANKIIVDSTGKAITGTMPNNDTVSLQLDTTATSLPIAKGYHSGQGTASIILETKSATPTKSSQTISPSGGKVLSEVTVDAIPDAYVDVSKATASAAHILSGRSAGISNGVVKPQVVTGTMANNGDTSATIDGLTVTSYTIPAGYTAGGTVTLTDDIETVLAAI